MTHFYFKFSTLNILLDFELKFYLVVYFIYFLYLSIHVID